MATVISLVNISSFQIGQLFLPSLVVKVINFYCSLPGDNLESYEWMNEWIKALIL